MRTSNRVLGLLAVAACSLSAGNFSFTGTFTTDDQVQIFDLSLASTTAVTFETLGYGGGTNSAGTVIPPGGFDPLLSWFAADGTLIGSNNGGTCGVGGPPNSYLGACNDDYASVTLDAGSYFLALTESGNGSLGSGFPGDLSLGFQEQGQGNYTANGPCTQFCDALSGDQLTGNWAVDVLEVTTASPQSSTPEPGTVALTITGLSLLAFAGHRLKRFRRADFKQGAGPHE